MGGGPDGVSCEDSHVRGDFDKDTYVRRNSDGETRVRGALMRTFM